MDSDEKLLSVPEVAEQLGLTRHTVAAWIKRDIIPGAQRVGRRYVVPSSSMQALEAYCRAWRKGRWAPRNQGSGG